ncbi:DUF3768 domain-containing protein [Sphingobium sp. CAP-1]|uniref:DUF3768 domain-containing protein n=1 Tax=Sphingobium sp. CAP-1 TaxID=2676077 RepID=UPI0018AD25DB|nr:DUF3768 domain-containing protein [Sphingobium sp. CAP-1]
MPQPSQQSADRAERIDRIAALNDSLRRSICSPGRNQIVMTAGVAALVGDVSLFRGFRRRAEILRTVRNYDSFNSDNDPLGEHDFGRFEYDSAILYWKIDLYDPGLVKIALNGSFC